MSMLEVINFAAWFENRSHLMIKGKEGYPSDIRGSLLMDCNLISIDTKV